MSNHYVGRCELSKQESLEHSPPVNEIRDIASKKYIEDMVLGLPKFKAYQKNSFKRYWEGLSRKENGDVMAFG